MMAVLDPPKRLKSSQPSKMDELRARVQRARQAAVWQHEQRTLEKIEKKRVASGAPKKAHSQSFAPHLETSGNHNSQDNFHQNAPIQEFIDLNGAYVEATTRIPSSRVWAMSFLGVCIGTALILIISPLMGSSGEEVQIFSHHNDRERSALATAENIKATKTIFPYDPNSPNNDFQVFAMPMKARKITQAPQEVGSIRNQKKPPQLTRTFTPQRIVRSAEVIAAAGAMTPRTVCVRMCDGYFFPLSNIKTGANLAAQEAMCRAACPASTTKLFTLAAGSESIDQAISLQGANYTTTSMAYAYERATDSTCACRRSQQASQTNIRLASLKTSPQTATDAQYSSASAPENTITLLNDPTLQPGDAVVIGGQAKVFSGKVGNKRGKEDFIDFRTTKMLSQLDKNKLDQTVGVSRQEALYKQIQNSKRVLDKSAIIRNSDGVLVSSQDASRKNKVSQNDVIIKTKNKEGKQINARVISLKLPDETKTPEKNKTGTTAYSN